MLASKIIHLSVDKETARTHIIDRVDTIRTTREGDRIKISSPSGVVLAHLSNHELPGGEQGSRLEYRSGASLFMSSYGVKARRIRDAVSKYEV